MQHIVAMASSMREDELCLLVPLVSKNLCRAVSLRITQLPV
jgi:hypothetical protein